jgi:metallo-beta-lactamase class B
MTRSALALAGVLALAACATTTPAAPPVTQATVQAHLDAAAKAADGDLKQLLSLCKAAPATRPKGTTITPSPP